MNNNSLVTDLNHITLAVTDIEISFKFYRDILEFKPLCKWHLGAYFLVNNFWFCLNVDKNRIVTPCYTHYAFSVLEDNFTKIRERLFTANVPIFKEDVVEGKSIFFLDPDGHKLEIHVGDWHSRMDAKKKDSGKWQNVEFYI